MSVVLVALALFLKWLPVFLGEMAARAVQVAQAAYPSPGLGRIGTAW